MNLLKLVFLRSALSISVFVVFLGVAATSSLADEVKKKKPTAARKANPAMARVTDVEGLPRILLIGDSISIGYTVAVREELKGLANVHRPLTNCGPTISGLKGIDAWLKTGGEGKKWDVIHFNWGLHDLKYMGVKGQNLADPTADDSVQQVPPAEYEKNLRTLVERLQKTGATLIWRNTTPVPPGAGGRVVGDAVKYNEIAAKVMQEHGISTDDLYTVSLERMAEIMRPANVHFTPEGSKLLGEKVAETIRAALEERN